MKHLKTALKWILAIFMIVAGINHFRDPEMYMKIMPPYLPWHRELVLISGVFESVLGLMLLVPSWSRLAAWGLIALFVAIFPANIYLYQNQHLLPAPPLAHLIRLPLQGVLIAWAWWYTRPDDTGMEKPES